MSQTLHLRVSSNTAQADEVIQQAAEIIRRGGLVAFPTETVYGLGANALDAAAVARIFAAKKRPLWDPVIVHASSIAMARELVTSWPEPARRLAERFLPGPLTLLLPKREVIPDACTAGREKVGLRIPAHPVALRLIEAAGLPIAAPSANRFGRISPTTAEHVLRDLDGHIDAILDAGPCAVGVESTVIDPSTKPPIIYRPGGLSREEIEAVIGPVRVARPEPRPGTPPESLPSPGLGIRHYAPRARLLLVNDERELELEMASHLGRRIGLMLPEGWLAVGTADCTLFDWGAIDDPETLASRLYQGLRWLDEQKVELILCPLPPATGLGLAILDRLRKAAG